MRRPEDILQKLGEREKSFSVDASYVKELEYETNRLVGQSGYASFRLNGGDTMLVRTSERFPFLKVTPIRTTRIERISNRPIPHPKDPIRYVRGFEYLETDNNSKRAKVLHGIGYVDGIKPVITVVDINEPEEAKISAIQTYHQLLEQTPPAARLDPFGRTFEESLRDKEDAKKLRTRVTELLEYARSQDALGGKPNGPRHAIFQEPPHTFIAIYRLPGADVIRIPTYTEKIGENHHEVMYVCEIPDSAHPHQQIRAYQSDDIVDPSGKRVPSRFNDHFANSHAKRALEKRLADLGPEHVWRKDSKHNG